MKNVIAFSLVLAAGAAVAVPEVSSVQLVQAGARRGEVSYSLSAPAVVTAEFFTNGVSVSDTALISRVGDIQRKVSAGAHRFYFAAEEGFPELSADMRVELKAWPLDNPPDYMYVDLVATNTVRYYLSATDLPGGLDDLRYRKWGMLMRKIPAKNAKFVMGLASTAINYDASMLTPREVGFTDNYYMAVWELTYAQADPFVPGFSYDPHATNGVDAVATSDTYPKSSISYCELRCNTNNTSVVGCQWPTDGHAVGEHSLLGMLRRTTGVDFDLPTEAQWEFACHGGYATGLGDGNEIGLETPSLALNAIAWNLENSGRNGGKGGDGNTVHATGLKKPNGYGLYDMHGNLFELCLDRYVASSSSPSGYTGNDPKGPTDTAITKCPRKGAHWYNSLGWYHVSYRNSASMTDKGPLYGTRLACPAEAR